MRALDGGVSSTGDVSRTLLELTAILDNAAVAIIFTRDRVIQRCNRRTAEIFGYRTPEDLIGKPGIVIHPDDQSYERIGREAGPLLAAGQSFHADWLFRKADGSPVWCRVYGKAVDPSRTDHGTVWILEDISEAKRTEEAFRETLRQMEAIMQNASVGILFTRDRRIVRHNPRFAEMYGYVGDDVLGLPARVLYRSDEEYDALGRVAAPLLSQGKPFQTELFMRRRDGSDIWVNLIGYVQNLENTREGTIWIAEDRTAFKQAALENARLYDEARRAVSELQAKNAELDSFVYTVSHDLRGPLGSIEGLCSVLIEDHGPRLDPEARRYLERIQANIEGMGRLIADVLALSQVGREARSPETVNLNPLVTALLGEAESQLRARSITVTVGDLGSLWGVRTQIEQVFRNLITNAAKYIGDAPTPHIELGTAARGAFRECFIRDTGIGIAPEHHERVFELFQRLREVDVEGTGVGLPIVKKIVEAAGGRVWVESAPGQGSTFRFTWPLPPGTAGPRAF